MCVCVGGGVYRNNYIIIIYSDVPRIFEVGGYFQSHKYPLLCKVGLRGGYFCLEVVSTNRPVWAHYCMCTQPR